MKYFDVGTLDHLAKISCLDHYEVFVPAVSMEPGGHLIFSGSGSVRGIIMSKVGETMPWINVYLPMIKSLKECVCYVSLLMSGNLPGTGDIIFRAGVNIVGPGPLGSVATTWSPGTSSKFYTANIDGGAGIQKIIPVAPSTLGRISFPYRPNNMFNIFFIRRNPANPSDTYAGDVRLHGAIFTYEPAVNILAESYY